MAENPPEKDHHNVIVRTCRVVMDIKVRISEIPDDYADGFITLNEKSARRFREWIARQRRLLAALLQDRELFDRYLIATATEDLGMFLGSERIDDVTDEAAEEIFVQVYSGLNSEDRAYFEAVRKDGLLLENIELIFDAFESDWQETKLIEMRVLHPEDEDSSSTSFPDK